MDLMGVGTAEVLMILLVALLVIGPNKVVEFGRTMGKIVRTIKKASLDLTSSVTKELELEDNEEINDMRYQLLHRTDSAMIEEKSFKAYNYLMIVH